MHIYIYIYIYVAYSYRSDRYWIDLYVYISIAIFYFYFHTYRCGYCTTRYHSPTCKPVHKHQFIAVPFSLLLDVARCPKNCATQNTAEITEDEICAELTQRAKDRKLAETEMVKLARGLLKLRHRDEAQHVLLESKDWCWRNGAKKTANGLGIEWRYTKY